MPDIEASEFDRWEVSPDGAKVRMTVVGADGALTAVVLPADALTSLVMTLPTIVERALRRSHRDPSIKLVYPLAGWTVEQAAGGDKLIVTLETPDGFKVSFAATSEDLNGLGSTSPADPKWPTQFN